MCWGKDAKEVAVLIESDWNLKEFKSISYALHMAVLIESDWNLKVVDMSNATAGLQGINKIRLEFKDLWYKQHRGCNDRINRIRLEFKDYLII